jgi:hypothetical protein
LISQTGTQPGAASFAEWREFFVPLLLSGANDYPEIMIPVLANLAGDEQSGLVAAGVEPPVFVSRYKIDRGRLEGFLGERLDDGLRLIAAYRGNNVYATRAKDDAKVWLEEREIPEDRSGQMASSSAPSHPCPDDPDGSA